MLSSSVPVWKEPGLVQKKWFHLLSHLGYISNREPQCWRVNLATKWPQRKPTVPSPFDTRITDVIEIFTYYFIFYLLILKWNSKTNWFWFWTFSRFYHIFHITQQLFFHLIQQIQKILIGLIIFSITHADTAFNTEFSGETDFINDPSSVKWTSMTWTISKNTH